MNQKSPKTQMDRENQIAKTIIVADGFAVVVRKIDVCSTLLKYCNNV
jgi:hypothetical protein